MCNTFFLSFFGRTGRSPSLPRDFIVFRCERCRIRTRDYCLSSLECYQWTVHPNCPRVSKADITDDDILQYVFNFCNVLSHICGDPAPILPVYSAASACTACMALEQWKLYLLLFPLTCIWAHGPCAKPATFTPPSVCLGPWIGWLFKQFG